MEKILKVLEHMFLSPEVGAVLATSIIALIGGLGGFIVGFWRNRFAAQKARAKQRSDDRPGLIQPTEPQRKRIVGTWSGSDSVAMVEKVGKAQNRHLNVNLTLTATDEGFVGKLHVSGRGSTDAYTVPVEGYFLADDYVRIDYHSKEGETRFGSWICYLGNRELKGKFVGFSASEHSLVEGQIDLEKHENG